MKTITAVTGKVALAPALHAEDGPHGPQGR
jgi:hypothetical protein